MYARISAVCAIAKCQWLVHTINRQADLMFGNEVQDNTVSYELFSQTGMFAPRRACSRSDYTADVRHFAEAGQSLQELQLECMAVALPYTTGYIWQQDPFQLHSSAERQSPWSKSSARMQRVEHSIPEHLWGVTRFADNIEDEWFIVWLLSQITSKVSSLSIAHCTAALVCCVHTSD